jgi:hypothetical protein
VDCLRSRWREIFYDEPFFVSLPHRHDTDVDYYSLGAEKRGHEVFTALYRSRDTYVFDRWSTVTSVVYNRLRGVENPRWLLYPDWLYDVRLVALSAEPEMLLKRLQSRVCCRDRYSLDRVKFIVEQYDERFREIEDRAIPVLRAESSDAEKIVKFIQMELQS